MGWSFMHRPRGLTSANFFAAEFGVEFKATASKNGVFYAVQEIDGADAPALVPDTNGKVRIALIVLTKRAKGQYNFGYKTMDEFAGPYGADEMPKRLLKMLSPFRFEAAFVSAKYSPSIRWASAWRNKNQAAA